MPTVSGGFFGPESLPVPPQPARASAPAVTAASAARWPDRRPARAVSEASRRMARVPFWADVHRARRRAGAVRVRRTPRPAAAVDPTAINGPIPVELDLPTTSGDAA